MSTKIFARNADVELSDIGLSPQVESQLRLVGKQKNASPLETLENSLRQHFCLPVPEYWKI